MNEFRKSILDKLSQFREQYKIEVPGSRQAWPGSVKDLVCELFDSGMTASEISRASEISYYTVNTWVRGRRLRKRAVTLEGFNQAKIVAAKATPSVVKKEKPKNLPATVTVALPVPLRDRQQPVVTVTVTTPSGFKVEGLPAELAMELVGGRK